MQKENQRVALSKRLLKDGLLRLLSEKTIDKINVTELCADSGINRATFYRHYASPRAVLDDIKSELSRGIQAYARDINLDDAVAYLEDVCTYMQLNANTVKVLMNCNLDAEFLQVLNECCDALMERKMTSYMKREIDIRSVQLMYCFFCGGGYFLLRRWILSEINKTPREVAELIMSFFNLETAFNII